MKVIRLKRLKMKNIRSYKDQEIYFPEGTVLIEGDIGSGKSTILMSIEFVLFGGGDIDYSSLLRIGEESGSVELTLEINGKDYVFYRELKRNSLTGKIEQKTCYIESENERKKYSATEMKAAVLKLLNFKEPKGARASSVVFRYSIYTPQEEMKSLILEDKDEIRLETIRKIFNLEKYNIAKENSKFLSSSLNMKIKAFQKLIEKEPEIRRRIEEEQRNIEIYINQISEYEKLELELNLEKENLEKDFKKAMDDYNSVQKKDKELSEHRKYLNKLKEDERKKLEKIKELESKTEELKNMANSISIPEMKYNKDKLEEEIENIQSEINSRNKGIGEINKDIENYNDLISKGICPVCKREVHPHEFEKELYSLEKKLQEEERILKELNDQLNGLKGMKKDAEYAEKLVITKQNYLDQMRDIEKLLSTEKEELNRIKEEIENERKRVEELSSVPKILEEVKEKVENLNNSKSAIYNEINKITGKLEYLRARKEETEKRLSDLKKDLDEIEKAKRDVERFSNLINFLDDIFEPAMDDIELSVFANINREMNELVSSWFIKLVPDPQKEIKVDENFAPRVTQSGYDLGIESLSGGEKSAVALSYRLALNSLLNNYSGSLGLLILDEPTDGFSKEQLQKFGDVLRDLNSKQIIIVSHESELENVSDRIIKVEKRDGLSSLELM